MRFARWAQLSFAALTLGACATNPRPKAVFSETAGERCPDAPDASVPTPPVPKRAPSAPLRDPADIQRVVRANFDRFRACYDRGLKRLPNLRGRVQVKFVIEPDGSVSKQAPVFSQPSQPGSGELLDCEVVTCIVNGFASLRFSTIDAGQGIATVVYPIIFDPGADDDASALAVLDRLQPEFKRCYAATPATKSDRGGSVIIVTRIAPSGAVTSAEPEGASLDPQVVACLQRAVAGAVFDPSASAHTLDVPVRFNRADAGD